MQRRIKRWGALFLVGFAAFVVYASADAASPSQEFAAAKQSFLKEMKKTNPVARAAAVEDFSNVLQTGTAELLLKRGFLDDDPKVRLATRAALRKLASDSIVCGYLIDQLKKSIRKKGSNDATTELFRALLAVDAADRQADLEKFVEEFVSSFKSNLLVPITMIDEFAEQGDVDAVHSIAMLSKARIFETDFGYRRSIVQAMTHIKKPEAVDFLIQLLPTTEGLIQHDVVRFLTQLTKQKFRDDHQKWDKWWKENRKEFQFPEVDAAAEVAETELDDMELSYYGIPICAKRVVFVLDTSSSMHGPPIDAAKRALVKTIESLPEAVHFDVVMFDTHAATWQPRLVAATEESKKLASSAVYSRGLGPATVSNAAMAAAFRLDPEAIYFVSDGEPTDGPPAQIVGAVTQMNRTRRISIHAIGVVTNRRGGAGLTMFMKPLSSKNYGTFLLIE